MATAKTGSSKKVKMERMVGNDVVVPCLFNGTQVGKGKYMTGLIRNELVLGSDGLPMKLRTIGALVRR